MKKRLLPILAAVVVLATVLCVPALALTEAEVEAQVAASGKGAVTGNVLIWFLCAVAFLKVSQKIDSFLSVLGVNVGNTGGSMLGDAMVAMRTVSMMVGGGRAAAAGRAGASSGGSSGKSGTAAGTAGFFKGGLVGMAGRHITNSAVKTATTQTSAVHTAQQSAVHTAAHSQARQAGAAVGTANPNPDGSSIPTDSVSAPMGGVSDPMGGVNSAPMPPQEGTILTGSGAPDSVPASGSVPPAPEPVSYSSSPPQEGTVLTGAEAAPPISTSGPVPAESGPVSPSSPPPQEGTILTGSEAPLSVPTSGPVPPVSGPVSHSGPPPQEGTILTGNEAPASMPQPDSAPESIGSPPESAPADVTPPQEGVIVTGGESTVHTPQTENVFAGGAEGTAHVENTAVTGNGRHTQSHTERSTQTARTASSERVQTSRFHSAGATALPTLGGMVFSHSLASGGSFANSVIGTVARGEVAGSITGDMAAQSLASYMGQPGGGIGSREAPAYSDVEIGRGRITGTETAAGSSEGRPFAMYHAGQYTAPSGEYTKVTSADGSQWYKQYAQPAVERKPYMAPDGTVAYEEKIVKRLPNPPRRKDRI